MAPVSLGERFDRARETDDRAQLLLVGALSLAIALVAVALILNSAIYTHNLASRQDSPSEGPVTFARDVRAGAGESLEYANRREGTDGYGDITNVYADGVGTLGTAVDGRAAVDVVATRVTPVGSGVRGVRVVHESGAFEPRSTGSLSGVEEWTVARGVRVRSFGMAVEPPGAGGLLTQLGLGEVENFLDDLSGGSDVFTVEFADDTGTWRVAIYESTAGEPTVTVHEVGTSVFRSCSVPATGGPVTVDFTGARFGGQPCAPLGFLEDLSGSYTVRYVRGDLASGSYELYADLPIDGTGSEAGTFTDAVDEANYDGSCDGPTYAAPTSGDSPRVVPALYATELDLRYDSPDVSFAATQRVAPGDPGPAPVEPRILDVSVTDLSGDDDEPEFEVTVTTTDPNEDLDLIEVRIPGEDLESELVSGGTVTRTLTVAEGDADGGPYDVEVTVTDEAGNSRTVQQTHDADGNPDGCPP